MLLETQVDLTKIYFHGSSEPKITKLDIPSYRHPFYVTPDLHYAMAFCTKDQSNTGDYDFFKKFTPADDNFVYIITLKPNCNVFDFSNQESSEFKNFFKFFNQGLFEAVKNYCKNANDQFDYQDIYEFCVVLNWIIFQRIKDEKCNYPTYHHRCKVAGIQPLDPKYFLKAKAFMKKNNLYNISETHAIMEPILKYLHKSGFKGILTKESDTNDQTNTRVTTNYAVGIFDQTALDMICVIPMKYKWLKKINKSFVQDFTSLDAENKIKRYIELYKKLYLEKR